MEAAKIKTNKPLSTPKTQPPPLLQQYALKLSSKQKRYNKWIYPLWVFCELVAILMGKKKLTPRENTKRCYEDFFDPLCAHTGVWPDYTEGYYENGDENYDEAKLKQFNYILDKTGAKAGLRLLDIGCGNGKLAQRAMQRGCHVTGITVSTEQAKACQEAGVDVRLMDFEQADKEFKDEKFDIIILNGPTEHFVTEEMEYNGESDAMRSKMFNLWHSLLNPGGKLFITCIHFRSPSNIKEVIKHPIKHKIGSYFFQCSVLVRIYSGWYPDIGTYESIAEQLNFKLILDREATQDYFITSVNWSKRLKTFVKENPIYIKRFLKDLFFKDPRYFFMTYLFWIYDPWTWQFAGNEQSPMIHKWLMFEKMSLNP